MKNKFIKNWGIFFLIITFSIIFAFFLCWLIKTIVGLHGIYLSSDFDLLNAITYFIGYTDVSAYSSVAKIVKLILAILGLIFTAFITSILTMHLIKSNKTLKIKSDLIIEKDDSSQLYNTFYKAKPIIQNGLTDLFQINIVFLLYKNGEVLLESETKTLPFLRKRTRWNPVFEVNFNSPLFQFLLFNKIRSSKDDLSLIFYVNYISDYSGEQYHSFHEYTKNSFIFSESTNNQKNELCNFFNWAEETTWFLPLDTYIPIKSDVHYSSISASKEDSLSKLLVRGKFDSQCQEWAFAMILFKLPFGGNWLFFYDNDCSIEFNIEYQHPAKLRLEIKNELQQHILDSNDSKFDLTSGTHKFKVRELNPKRSIWEHVLELCFTTFNHKPNQTNNKQQRFCYTLSNLKMVFPQNDSQEGRS